MPHIDYESEAELSRAAVAEQLREIASDFEDGGQITVSDEDTTVTVPGPEADVEYEVELEREPTGTGVDEIELELEFEWTVVVDAELADADSDETGDMGAQRIEPEADTDDHQFR